MSDEATFLTMQISVRADLDPDDPETVEILEDQLTQVHHKFMEALREERSIRGNGHVTE